MSNVLALSLRARNAMLTALMNDIDSAATAGKVNIYSGTRPAVGGDAITTQVLLATLVFSKPCGTVANGTLTFSAINQDAGADATGTAAWGRILDGSNNFVADVDAGISTTTPAPVLVFNTLSLVLNVPVAMTSFSVSMSA
jgi:hypothetical protein